MTTKRTTRIPTWFTTAHQFYGSAFGHDQPTDLAAAMADWTRLTDAERAFAQAHLTYLLLESMVAHQRMLGRLYGLLEEVGESVDDFLESEDPTEEVPADWESAQSSPPGASTNTPDAASSTTEPSAVTPD